MSTAATVSPVLPILLGVPALGAGLLLGLPLSRRTSSTVAVVSAVVALVVSVVAGRDVTDGGFHDVVDVSWLPDLGTRFHLGVDGISTPLIVLTALLTLLCAVHSVTRDTDRLRQQLGLLLLLEVGSIGTFAALDLVLFFVFFEVVLVPMWFLIALWGGADRRRAANQFILYTLLGSGLMLVAFLLIGSATGTTDIVALTARHGAGIATSTQVGAAVLLLLGFGVKSPMWPLHTWLPDAHTEAPTVGSVLLAGVLLKLGTYGFVRVFVPTVPAGAHDVAPVLGVLGVVGILYGSLACLAIAQEDSGDLKRLVAFSSVGHMGFVLLAVATLDRTGVEAAVIGSVAHGLVTGLLFFLVGGVKERFGTSRLGELGGGLLTTVPALGGVTVLASVASLGLPGLAGFWGEVLSLVAAYHPQAGLPRPLYVALAVLAAAGTATTTVYFVTVLRRVAFGGVGERWRQALPLPVGVGEAFAWVPLAVLTVAVGVWPKLVLGLTDAATRALR